MITLWVCCVRHRLLLLIHWYSHKHRCPAGSWRDLPFWGRPQVSHQREPLWASEDTGDVPGQLGEEADLLWGDKTLEIFSLGQFLLIHKEVQQGASTAGWSWPRHSIPKIMKGYDLRPVELQSTHWGSSCQAYESVSPWRTAHSSILCWVSWRWEPLPLSCLQGKILERNCCSSQVPHLHGQLCPNSIRQSFKWAALWPSPPGLPRTYLTRCAQHVHHTWNRVVVFFFITKIKINRNQVREKKMQMVRSTKHRVVLG